MAWVFCAKVYILTLSIKHPETRVIRQGLKYVRYITAQKRRLLKETEIVAQTNIQKPIICKFRRLEQFLESL